MIEKAMFGAVHHESSRVIFGGASLSAARRAQGEKAFQALRRYGVNHIDTSVSYGAAGVLLKAQKLGMARHIGVTGHAWDAPRMQAK